MPSSYCPTCRRFYRVSLITWSANVARVFSSPCMLNHPTDRSISVQTLPFLRILIAACSHSRAMSNAILANRLIRAVIPCLTRSILPQSDTKSAEATEGNGSSKRKGKKRARGYEGDEVFKTSPGVLLGSPLEERVVMLSVEGDGVPMISLYEVLSVLQHYDCCQETRESRRKSIRYHRDFSSRCSFTSRGFPCHSYPKI